MIYKYKLVATGGTFDRFHKGHKALLERAFAVGRRVIIGVTSDWMISREPRVLREIVLPYEKRVGDLKIYLKQKEFLGKEIIEKLNDIYGPTVINGNVQAVVCTRETKSGAVAINKERAKHGKKRLAIIECSFITSSDHYHISSTRIRLGQIDRQGQILTKQQFGLLLPDKLRGPLAKPIDMLYPDVVSAIKTISKPVMLISVGDVVYQKLKLQGISPNITIVDLKIGRKNLALKGNPFQGGFDYVVKNKAGTVSKTLINTLKKAVKRYLLTKKTSLIRIIGEEDLAVIPAILTAPLQSVILYGQPAVDGIKAGVVRVIVTEEKKKWTVELLKKFKS